jgi:hypothetical protein
MKFIVDANLGKLAKELRMLGYDTVYYRGKDLHELTRLARQQDRVILTRTRGLTPEIADRPVILIPEDDPRHQLKGLLGRQVVSVDQTNLFSRCLLCNTLLKEINREEAKGEVPDYIYQHHQTFHRCPQCHRHFWPGSHLEKMKKRLEP